MKYFILLIATILTCQAQAQISHGGQPHNWKSKEAPVSDFIAVPARNLEKLKLEDASINGDEGQPYRFGENIPVDLDINNSGEWTNLENGDGIWRLGISSKGALSINFVFDLYMLPEGGRVYVYTADKSQVIGSFTAENASHEQSMGVGFLFSDKIVIEYHEPAAVRGQGYLHINNITHGYREINVGVQNLEKEGPFGDSDACNINVNCPEGLPYDIQKRSVAIIVVGNNGICSGALVNNTAQDQTPYFLTANHCMGSGSNIPNWIFYFNHERPGCDESGTAPADQSISGATLVSRHANSDFGLVELVNDIPASYNVCYSGWDATDSESAVSSAYGIHHPGGDVKKICFENDAPYHVVNGGFANLVWWIEDWELGVTEGGSSGSPLFDQNGNIIGQLAGGLAACNGPVNNGQYDFYGRFGISWTGGGTPQTRLRDWLDPTNSGTLVLGNSCAGSSNVNDVTLGSMNGLGETLCNTSSVNTGINVINVGTNNVVDLALSVTVNGIFTGSYEWTGNIAPFESANVNFGNLALDDGYNDITVEVVSVNGGEDEGASGNTASDDIIAFASSEEFNLSISFDDYASETSWRIIDQDGNIIHSGSGYIDNVSTALQEDLCLGNGCYTFIIEDSWGDGICCEFGQGSYTLLDQNGEVIVTGGNFGSIEATEFCVSGLVSTKAVTDFSGIALYPNPTSGNAFLDFGNFEGLVRNMSIVDASGRIVKRFSNINTEGQRIEIQSEAFGNGIYLLLIETDFGTTVKKLAVVN